MVLTEEAEEAEATPSSALTPSDPVESRKTILMRAKELEMKLILEGRFCDAAHVSRLALMTMELLPSLPSPF